MSKARILNPKSEPETEPLTRDILVHMAMHLKKQAMMRTKEQVETLDRTFRNY